jgi:hypothetical protein
VYRDDESIDWLVHPQTLDTAATVLASRVAFLHLAAFFLAPFALAPSAHSHGQQRGSAYPLTQPLAFGKQVMLKHSLQVNGNLHHAGCSAGAAKPSPI